MALTRGTRRFLIALAALIGVVFAVDAWRAGRPDEVTPPPVAPPVEVRSEARRGAEPAWLLQVSEVLRSSIDRVSPSLVHAVPSSGAASRGIVFDGHVLVGLTSGAERWHLRFGDGARAQATLVASDPVHGVGLLAIAGTPPPAALIAATRELRVGEPVLIASPGAEGTAARSVQWPGQLRLLAGEAAALDAPALLFSIEGELLGLRLGPGAEAEILSAADLQEIGEALVRDGRHEHPWMGAELQDIDASLRPVFPVGAMVVAHVHPGSPAARAGLREGSTWEAFEQGDRQARRASDLAELLAPLAPVRALPPDGRGEPVTIETIDRQWSPPRGTPTARRGIVADTPEVRITVVPGTAAATSGLRDGDVVVALDGRPVASQGTLAKTLADPRAHLLKVRRDGRHWLFALPPAEDRASDRAPAPGVAPGGTR
jgi:S1-C subfamily serine protease